MSNADPDVLLPCWVVRNYAGCHCDPAHVCQMLIQRYCCPAERSTTMQARLGGGKQKLAQGRQDQNCAGEGHCSGSRVQRLLRMPMTRSPSSQHWTCQLAAFDFLHCILHMCRLHCYMHLVRPQLQCRHRPGMLKAC